MKQIETDASALQYITVPPMKEVLIDVPFDAGSIECTLPPRFFPGHVAPELEFTLDDGRVWKLSEHRGKPVVILFWGSYSMDAMKQQAKVIQKWVDAKKIHAIGLEMG